jgi:hypothetical protein
MGFEERLERLRSWQRLLDSAFRIPGTRLRFGWDPIIGLVPWVGDLVTALMACVIVVHAHRLRVPRIVQARMLLNIAIDLMTGVVPFFGDVADVFWKANTRNLALLERHASPAAAPTRGDWLFVLLTLAGVTAVAVVPLIVLYWIVHVVLGRSLV